MISNATLEASVDRERLIQASTFLGDSTKKVI